MRHALFTSWWVQVASAQSVARQWNEQLLHAISIDTARPTVHARNLFHLSTAMYDAWAAYDPTATQYLHHEKLYGRRHRGGSQRGDQLRRVQSDQASLRDRTGRRRAWQSGNAGRHRFPNVALGLRPEFHVDGRQLARGARQSHRAVGDQSMRSPTAPTKRTTTQIRPASRR